MHHLPIAGPVIFLVLCQHHLPSAGPVIFVSLALGLNCLCMPVVSLQHLLLPPNKCLTVAACAFASHWVPTDSLEIGTFQTLGGSV